MRGLIIETLAADLIDAELRRHGQQLTMLPAAVRRIERDARPFESKRTTLTTDDDVPGRNPLIRRAAFCTDEGATLRLPPIIATFRLDDEGDVRMGIQEMAFSTGATLSQQMNHLEVVLHERLPDTVTLDLTGRPLREVVAHPVLDTRELRIIRVRTPQEDNLLLGHRPIVGTVLTFAATAKTILPLD